jgi:hypothetical protein
VALSRVVRDDRYGQLGCYAFAAPVRPGERAALADAIAQLGPHDRSPFGRLGTVHFARLVLMDDLPRPGATTLWCSVDADGTLEQLGAGIARHLPAEADAVFAHCHDWPGARDEEALLRWLRAHRMPAHYVLAAHPDATVAQIRAALARRRAFTELLLRAQAGAPAAELREAFRTQVMRP